MAGVITILREVRDPRQVNARHDLGDILFVALAAMLCGAKTCVEIAEFAEDRLDQLREMVDLAHGAPSHDTFSRVFRLLDPQELAKTFEACLGEMRQALKLGAPKGVVAIDGKSLRRGYEKGRSHMPPLMVSVYESQTRLCLAQARAPEGAEITATLDLLKGLVLKGCTVTADALHCTVDMARAIRAAKAHYALGLKANRHQLLAEVEAAFAAAGEDVSSFETRDTRHGRQELRRASVLDASRLQRTFGFPDLKAVGRIQAERVVDGRAVASVRYVLLSKAFSPRKLQEAVRAHWSIENQLHWKLDVIFDEDDARTRKNYAPENLAIVRRQALNILNACPSNYTTARKMRRASWDRDFFFGLFAHMR